MLEIIGMQRTQFVISTARLFHTPSRSTLMPVNATASPNSIGTQLLNNAGGTVPVCKIQTVRITI